MVIVLDFFSMLVASALTFNYQSRYEKSGEKEKVVAWALLYSYVIFLYVDSTIFFLILSMICVSTWLLVIVAYARQ